MEGFEPTIIKLSKAFKIPQLEPEDIANELRLHLWKNRKKYNPKKAKYKNWAYICCRNKIRDLAKYYHAQKRDICNTISLDELKEQGFEL